MNAMTESPGTAALNARQRLFVAEYLRDKNATQAAIRAGYSVRSARSIATENLSKPAIRSAISKCEVAELSRIQEETGVTLERTLTEIARGAFFDVRRLFKDDGSPKAIHELDDETASVIEGIEVQEQFIGSGDERIWVGTIKKYRFAKRSTSLDMLMKHLNGYASHQKGAGGDAANALVDLLSTMRRSSLPVVRDVTSEQDGIVDV